MDALLVGPGRFVSLVPRSLNDREEGSDLPVVERRAL